MLDSGLSIFLAIGAMVGCLRGPFATILGLLSLAVTAPLLMFVHGPVTGLLGSIWDPVVVSIVYWPLGIFVCFALFSFLGKSLDGSLRKAAGRFWAMMLGAALGALVHFTMCLGLCFCLHVASPIVPATWVQGSLWMGFFQVVLNNSAKVQELSTSARQKLESLKPQAMTGNSLESTGLNAEWLKVFQTLLERKSAMQGEQVEFNQQALIQNLSGIANDPEQLENLRRQLEKSLSFSEATSSDYSGESASGL